MSKTKTTAQKTTEAAEALRLHSQGFSHRQIATILSEAGMVISASTVKRRIELALDSIVIPATEQAKAELLSQIEAVRQSQANKLASGDSKAADTVLKSLALKARILGLEAPSKTEVTKNEGPVPPIQKIREARLATSPDANQIENGAYQARIVPFGHRTGS